MSEEQLKAFIAKAKDDQAIQEKLKAAKTPEDVVGIAKDYGHEFANEHMTQLSEDELEGVAGGAGAGCIITPVTGLLNPSQACDTYGYAELGQMC